jgi:quercetin 2,3-dioxygenase
VPHTSRLAPKYYTRHFSDAEKADKWVRVVGPVDAEGVIDVREGEGPAPVHSPVALWATILGPGKRLTHILPETKGTRKAYLHVIQASGYNTNASTGARIGLSSGTAHASLGEGDGAYVMADPKVELVVENTSDQPAEVLLFDIDF